MASLRLAVANGKIVPPSGALKKKPRRHRWVDYLIEAVSIVTVMPGRIRFRLDFPGDEILADTLRRELHKLPNVKFESYSTRTRNALVSFNPADTNAVEITAALFRGIEEFARLHGDCDLVAHDHRKVKKASCETTVCEKTCAPEKATDANIRKELFKLSATGVVLTYLIYKRIRNPVMGAGPSALASFITVASGYPIFRNGIESVQKDKKASDDTLIGLAVASSLLLGESLTGFSVVWLIQLGRVLESITLKRSRTAVKELMDIMPTEAWLVNGAKPKRVPVDTLKKGQLIRVFRGEKVPLDGKIVEGEGLFVEAFLTGESLPRQKSIGGKVFAGSLVDAGEIDIEVTSLQDDTVVASMIDAIENLRDNKAPIEKVGARFASRFVPVSIGLAGVTFLLSGDIRRAITMLVIACPCAAGLATPTAVSASIGQVARKGILVKGGAHLEAAAKVDAIIFDKTGTLTVGKPALQQFVEVANGHGLGFDACLRLAASAEQHTTHPLGQVLVREAKERGIELSAVQNFKIHEGMGISGVVEGREVEIGSRRFMDSLAVSVADEGGKGTIETVLYLAVDKRLQGVYLVEDQARPDSRKMFRRLERLGIKRVLMATGDHKAAAYHMAEKLGIKEVHAELLPEDKLALVRRLKAEGHRVAMMGDGINDAQALAEADVSIAMGTSRCDVAIETADVTIARDDLQLVAEFFSVSKGTLATIYQNFIAAVGINSVGIVYGAAGRLTPFAAAIVHNLSTIVVVLNSLRLGKAVSGKNPLSTLKEVRI